MVDYYFLESILYIEKYILRGNILLRVKFCKLCSYKMVIGCIVYKYDVFVCWFLV